MEENLKLLIEIISNQHQILLGVFIASIFFTGTIIVIAGYTIYKLIAKSAVALEQKINLLVDRQIRKDKKPN